MKGKCKICKDKGVTKPYDIKLPSYRLNLCKEHFVLWIEKRVMETIKKFKMIKHTDKVLVAVSGGKDSLNIWHILNKLGYDTDGFYVNLGIDEYSEKSKIYADEFANRINKKLIVVNLKDELSTIEEMSKKVNRPPCSLCGMAKRYFFNKVAREKGYNILATGHNLDDEVAVLFTNTIQWDINYLKRQYPVLEARGNFIKKIKPMCKISEMESAIYSFLNGIKYIKTECPLSYNATSLKTKMVISQIEDKMPSFKTFFYMKFLKNMYPFLQTEEFSREISNCRVCGEPSVNEVCAFCKTANFFRQKR
jgi:uncharacterized protein (TIGR00269 family)